MRKTRQCASCGWVLVSKSESLCSQTDNRSCYRRRTTPLVVDEDFPHDSAEYRIASCWECRVLPTYRDVCIRHLFEESISDLMWRWNVTDSALYAVRKRRRPLYARRSRV